MDDQPAARLTQMDTARQVWNLYVKKQMDEKWGEHLTPHEETLLIVIGETDDEAALEAIASIS